MQDNLILIRKKSDVSQQKMADLIGVNPKTYSQKELGKTQFTMNEMFTIAGFFNKKIEDIFAPSILQNGVNEFENKEDG